MSDLTRIEEAKDSCFLQMLAVCKQTKQYISPDSYAGKKLREVIEEADNILEELRKLSEEEK